MKHFLSQLKWQLKILARNNLITISVAVTLIYTLIFYFLKDLPNTDKFLTLLIFNDPVIICFFFVGISIIMEKNMHVFSALFVSPLNHHAYLIAKVVALSLIGLACAGGMTIAMLGWQLSWVHFILGVIGTSAICGLAGIFVVSYADEFLQFTLRSIPLMIFLSLPLLNYFNLTDISLFNFTPMHGPLNLIIDSYNTGFDLQASAINIGAMTIWIGIIYWFVFKTFTTLFVNAY